MKFYFHITNLYTLGVCQNEDWISMICIMFIRIFPLIHTERFDCCELIGSSRGFLQRNEITNHSKCLYCVHQACSPAPKQINFFSEIADLVSNFRKSSLKKTIIRTGLNYHSTSKADSKIRFTPALSLKHMQKSQNYHNYIAGVSWNRLRHPLNIYAVVCTLPNLIYNLGA